VHGRPVSAASGKERYFENVVVALQPRDLIGSAEVRAGLVPVGKIDRVPSAVLDIDAGMQYAAERIDPVCFRDDQAFLFWKNGTDGELKREFESLPYDRVRRR
jgi:hypothetical protein